MHLRSPFTSRLSDTNKKCRFMMLPTSMRSKNDPTLTTTRTTAIRMRVLLCCLMFSLSVVNANVVPTSPILSSSTRRQRIDTITKNNILETRVQRSIQQRKCSVDSLDLVGMIPYGGGSAVANAKSSTKKESAVLSGLKNFVASGMAAACSKLILAPFDTIKTIQQHSRSAEAGAAALSLRQAAQLIMSRPKGFLEFYAGIGVAVIGSMPSVGLYFGVYSFCKRRFNDWNPSMPTFNIAMSAAIGNTIASSARVPYEVLKQQLQTGQYANTLEALQNLSLSKLFPTGGIASQMLRDIPYAMCTLLCYEHLRSKWKPRFEESNPSIPTRTWDLLIGGTSGGVGSFLTNPFDVIKTRLQTSSDLYGGSVATCMAATFQEGGPAAFLRGAVPRLLHKVPANAFFFLFYEFFRSLLHVQDGNGSESETVASPSRRKLE